MPRIAVIGGSGYLASLIKNQNNVKKNKYTFFSRKKSSKNYINYLSFKKNLNVLKNFDFIIHLAGPNQNQLVNDKSLIKKKNLITSMICDICLAHNIKLIYISSMQVYENYGKGNLSISSKINLKNPYSISHYESEKIITTKFLNDKNMFIVLRTGNVFGFKKYENLKEINNNIIHSLCFSAIKQKKILIENGSIQRTFIPSKIFTQVINFTIQKQKIKNSIINIFYKNFSLSDIGQIIKKRSKLILNQNITIIVKKFHYQKKLVIFPNKEFKITPINKEINNEIDQILKNIIKIIK